MTDEPDVFTADFSTGYGTEDITSIYIDDEKLDGYPKDITIELRLNELDTLEGKFYTTGDNSNLIVEDKEMYVFIGRDVNPYKFVITHVEPKSDYEIQIEAKGMGKRLQDFDTDRTVYDNTPADQVLTTEVTEFPTDVVESAPTTSIRTDFDNKLRLSIGLANQVGYDFYVSQKETDKYKTDYINFVEHKGSETPVTTLDIGNNAKLVKRDKDSDVLANDITALGYGDGVNQLKCRVFEAGPYTILNEDLSETQLGSDLYYSEGFEDGNTSDWVENGTSISATTDQILSGNYSGRIPISTSESAYVQSPDINASEPDVINIKNYINDGLRNNTNHAFIEFYDNNDERVFRLEFAGAGFYTSPRINYTGNNTLDNWAANNEIDISFKFDWQNNQVDVYKNNSLIGEDLPLDIQSDNIKYIQLGCESLDISGIYYYVDDIEVINGIKLEDTAEFGNVGDNVILRMGSEVVDADIISGGGISINSRGLDNYDGESTEQIAHYENMLVFLRENVTQGLGPYTPDPKDGSNAESNSSISIYGVKEDSPQDKEIVSKQALEQFACNELAARRIPPFRVQVRPVEPRIDASTIELGDTVTVKDVQAMDINDDLRVIGIDKIISAGREETTLHCSNRPKRLIEKLKELSRESNAESRHMQGATNIDSQNFADNCDETHPLNTKFYVPEDAKEVNKVDLVFNRESFRGYVQNKSHIHGIDGDTETNYSSNASEVSGTVTQYGVSTGADISQNTTVPDPSGDNEVNLIYIIINSSVMSSSGGSPTIDLNVKNNSTGDTIYSDTIAVLRGTEKITFVAYNSQDELSGDDIDVTQTISDDNGFSIDHAIQTSLVSISDHNHNINETSESSGEPEYGIFEPSSEPSVDVEVYVDGNLVTTVNNVSVGSEQATPIDLSQNLDTPIAGKYHDITLKPIDTGGGNNGRSRLNATVYQKVFINSD